MNSSEQQFLNDLDKKLWTAADKLRSTLSAAEKHPLTDSEVKLFEALQSLKKEVVAQILKNYKMLDNEDYVQKMIARLIISEMKNKHHIALDAQKTKRVYSMVVKEYLSEYKGMKIA